MPLNITKLQRAMDVGNGPTLASQFEVVFQFPQSLRVKNESFSSENMTLYCQAVTLPGTQIVTTDLPVYGPPVKMPYGLLYQDLSLQFICTNTMSQRQIFEEWRRLVVDPTSNYVNYYDTYIGNVDIRKLSQSGTIVHRILVEEAFPVAILEQELSTQGNDWLRITVQLSYRRWRSKFDIAAANRAGFDGTDPNPTPPGETQNPNDVFAGTPAPRVPRFEP
jgi:hypothetical protein